MSTYETEISEYMWEHFLTKFEAYKKKAIKLGFEEPAFKITKVIEAKTSNRPLRNVQLINCVEITYEMPIIDGWKVIGNRERIDDEIYTKVVTEDNCSKFHASKEIGCDHCHTNRLRNKSILLKKESEIIIENGFEKALKIWPMLSKNVWTRWKKLCKVDVYYLRLKEQKEND
jgi:hypothetical protein